MEKVSSKSMDIVDSNINKIFELFPNTCAEGKINFDKLKEELGEYIDDKEEKYEFTWNGKQESKRISQESSVNTLLPCKDKSKDWENTNNLYIEGDNLEVLKILQKSYNRKVKLIYIDPPYNTGSDFVYEDDFKDGLNKYKEQTLQGNKANVESSGRYHTKWLNMIYPRLSLAKNLLTDDGAIFISIDDNEYPNLKKICDEIFNESNFVANCFVLDNLKGKTQDNFITSVGSKLLVYAKNKNVLSEIGFNTVENVFAETVESKFKSQDEEGYYTEVTFKKTGQAKNREDRPYMYYPILEKEGILYAISDEEYDMIYNSDTKKFDDVFVESLREKYKDYNFILPTGSNGEILRWTSGFNTFKKKINKDIFFSNGIKQKVRPEANEMLQTYASGTPKTLMYKTSYSVGTQDLAQLFDNKQYFDFPKPIALMTDILNLIKFNDDDLVLDFFSGSATMAHAVMLYNTYGCKLNYIMVQSANELDDNSTAVSDGYKTICDIGEERIRRAGDRVLKDSKQELDIGFKVFKLESSNIKIWNGEDVDIDNANQYFYEHMDPIVEGRTEDDLLYEILLKEGMMLSSPVEEKIINDKKIYSIGMGYMIICLDDNIDTELVRKIGELRPETVIFKDSGFADENAKANALQELKKMGIEEEKVKSI